MVLLTFERLGAIPGGADSLRGIDLAAFDAVVFSSPSTAAFAAQARGSRSWGGARCAAIGPGTANALVAHGIVADPAGVLRPSGPDHDAMHLVECLREKGLRRLLVLRGEQTRTDWQAAAGGAHGLVQECVLFRDHDVQPAATAAARLRAWAAQSASATFQVTSARIATRLEHWLQAAGLADWAHRQPAIVPHRRIADTLRAARWRAVDVCTATAL